MLKKYMLVLPLFSFFTLMGCGAADITKIITDAQAYAQKTCSIVPLVQTITAIVNAGGITIPPGLTEGEAIGAEICAALNPPAKTKTMTSIPMVGKTVIHYWKVSP